MWYIVGLGNPGEEYVNTRHNTGRIMLEGLEKIKNKGMTLIAPDTFMNKSGLALKKIITNKKKALKLIVIHDDFNFPIGKFKISFNRSAGGHRGVESIIKTIKTEEFIRIRVGICPTTSSGKLKLPKDGKGIEELILGKFKPSELVELKKVSKRVTQAIEMIIAEGREKAMTEFNK
ncbi:MAG: aminoacyl-tRNA hydrolase [Patescibacteria group bacterium]|nr:aminoacyl-tRNA hydrolase [Patescibacteria group bacterium]